MTNACLHSLLSDNSKLIVLLNIFILPIHLSVLMLHNPTTQNPVTICPELRLRKQRILSQLFNSSGLKAGAPFAFGTFDWLPFIPPKLPHLDLDTRQL